MDAEFKLKGFQIKQSYFKSKSFFFNLR